MSTQDIAESLVKVFEATIELSIAHDAVLAATQRVNGLKETGSNGEEFLDTTALHDVCQVMNDNVLLARADIVKLMTQ